MDAIDRKLLAALCADAGVTYADLARRLHLSAPALHERVRKLKARGVIRRTTVDLDAASLGLALSAFVHVETEGWACEPVRDALRPNGLVEEMHSVAGATCLILKVRAATAMGLEDLLRSIYDLPGVRRTESFVVLRTYIERGPDPLAAAAGASDDGVSRRNTSRAAP